MLKLSFFTPLVYITPSKTAELSLLEKADNYFYLGGKKAYVIQGRTKNGQEKVVLSESRSSLLTRIGKVLSYFSLLVPFIMLIIKATLRSKHSFKIIDPKQKLEKGMDISASTAAKIQKLIPKIILGQDDEAIEWLAKGNNFVFKLKESPNIVYKMVPDGTMRMSEKGWMDSEAIIEERFANMVKAKRVCLVHDLSLLIIPHAKKIDVEASGSRYTLIAEEALDFEPNESSQEKLYHRYSTELNETAHQLAVFIAKTGFNDVTWRNIPILKEREGFQGSRRVALIDLEHMSSCVNGFLGDCNGSRGLIHCVSEAQIDIVIATATQQGVAISAQQAEQAKNLRLQELESDK
jgi:hypothetical protein